MKILRQSAMYCVLVFITLAIIASVFWPKIIVDMQYQQIPQFGIFFSAFSVVLIIFLITSHFKSFHIKIKPTIVVFALTVLFVTQLFFAFKIQRIAASDPSICSIQAFNLMRGGRDWPSYFSVYPNNVNITILQFWFYSILKWLGFSASNLYIGQNIAMFIVTDLSVFLGAKLVQRHLGINYSFVYVIFSILFIPYTLYSLGFYTDELVILFPILDVYLCEKLTNAKSARERIVFSVILSMSLELGYLIKGNTIVVWVAIMLYLLLKGGKSNHKLVIMFFVTSSVFIFVGSVGSRAIQQHLGYETNRTVTLPATNWTLMGLKDTTHGSYDDQTVKNALKIRNETERKTTVNKRIKKTVRTYGIEGMVYQLLNKLSVLWGTGTLQSIDWFGAWPKLPSIIAVRQNDVNFLISNVAQAFWYFLMILVLVDALGTSSKKEWNINQLSLLTILGITILHVFFWEVESRYLYLIIPLLIMTSCFGLKRLGEASHNIILRGRYFGFINLTILSTIVVAVVLASPLTLQRANGGSVATQQIVIPNGHIKLSRKSEVVQKVSPRIPFNVVNIHSKSAKFQRSVLVYLRDSKNRYIRLQPENNINQNNDISWAIPQGHELPVNKYKLHVVNRSTKSLSVPITKTHGFNVGTQDIAGANDTVLGFRLYNTVYGSIITKGMFNTVEIIMLLPILLLILLCVVRCSRFGNICFKKIY